MTLVEEKTLVTESVRLHRDAVEVAYEVGEYLRGVFRKPFVVEEKVDHTDLVTEHDRASERMIVAALRERDPSYGFLGEEFGAQPGEGPVTWHLDPIDGTSNFVQGHAFFCVSIAAEVEGRVVAGAVYDPMADNMFSADLERAYLNSEVLVTPQAKQPPHATIILSYPGARDLRIDGSAVALGHVEAALGAFASVLRAGSGALSLCSVAAGWADCTIGSSANSWDVAAAMLIVEKAGATYVPTYYGDDDPTAGPPRAAARRAPRLLARRCSPRTTGHQPDLGTLVPWTLGGSFSLVADRAAGSPLAGSL